MACHLRVVHLEAKFGDTLDWLRTSGSPCRLMDMVGDYCMELLHGHIERLAQREFIQRIRLVVLSLICEDYARSSLKPVPEASSSHNHHLAAHSLGRTHRGCLPVARLDVRSAAAVAVGHTHHMVVVELGRIVRHSLVGMLAGEHFGPQRHSLRIAGRTIAESSPVHRTESLEARLSPSRALSCCSRGSWQGGCSPSHCGLSHRDHAVDPPRVSRFAGNS